MFEWNLKNDLKLSFRSKHILAGKKWGLTSSEHLTKLLYEISTSVTVLEDMRHFHCAVQITEPQTDMCRCQGHTASVGDIKQFVGKVIDTQSPSVTWSLTGR